LPEENQWRWNVYPRKGRRKEEETDGQRQKGKKGKEASARASERASEREREREREREKVQCTIYACKCKPIRARPLM